MCHSDVDLRMGTDDQTDRRPQYAKADNGPLAQRLLPFQFPAILMVFRAGLNDLGRTRELKSGVYMVCIDCAV